MKERAIDRERAIVTHHQASKIPDPGVGTSDDPSSPVAPQRSAILRCGPHAILFVRADPFDPALPQALAQRIAVVRFVGDYPQRFLRSLSHDLWRVLSYRLLHDRLTEGCAIASNEVEVQASDRPGWQTGTHHRYFRGQF